MAVSEEPFALRAQMAAEGEVTGSVGRPALATGRAGDPVANRIAGKAWEKRIEEDVIGPYAQQRGLTYKTQVYMQPTPLHELHGIKTGRYYDFVFYGPDRVPLGAIELKSGSSSYIWGQVVWDDLYGAYAAQNGLDFAVGLMRVP